MCQHTSTFSLDTQNSQMPEGWILHWSAWPTVFADAAPTHRIAQEEIFGLVLSVMKAESFHDALMLANSTAYALTGGVYSRSSAHLELARQRFDVGNLYLLSGQKVRQHMRIVSYSVPP